MMEQQKLNKLVQKYIGIPYLHGGRDFDGVDCLGLAYLLYRDCGITMPEGDGSPYEKDWFKTDPERYLRGIRQLGKAVPLAEIQPLDFLYFQMGSVITHGGVMVDDLYFVHVLERTRVHLSTLNFKWRRRLVGARRFAY